MMRTVQTLLGQVCQPKPLDRRVMRVKVLTNNSELPKQRLAHTRWRPLRPAILSREKRFQELFQADTSKG